MMGHQSGYSRGYSFISEGYVVWLCTSAKILKKIIVVTDVLMFFCNAKAMTRHPVPHKRNNCNANRPRMPYLLATASESMPPMARAKMLQRPKEEAAIEAMD